MQTPRILNFNKLDKIFYISGLSLFSIWQESVVVRYHCIDCYDLRKVYFDLSSQNAIDSKLSQLIRKKPVTQCNGDNTKTKED